MTELARRRRDPAIKAALPFLIDALGDDEPQVRPAAAEALGPIGDPRAAGALREIVEEAHH